MTPQIRQILFVLFALAHLASGQTVFAPARNYSIPNPSRPVFADFNGDGKLDMVALSTSPDPVTPGAFLTSIYFFPGQTSPAGTFGPPTVGTTDVRTTLSLTGVLSAGDFDNDGKQDLFLAAANNFRFLKGVGDGSFQASINNGSGATQANRFEVADLNGDGNLDVVYGGFGMILSGAGNGRFNSGAQVFSTCSNSSIPQTTVTARLVDLNRDGRLDLVTGCSGSSAAVAYRNADLTFSAPVALTSFGGQIVVGDFNGDSINDVIVLGTTQRVMRLGAADGTLGAETSVTVPINPEGTNVAYRSLLSADFNQDGKPDLLLASSDSVAIAENIAAGNYAQLASLSVLGYRGLASHYVLDLQDLNNDGGLDLYLWNQSAGAITIYLNVVPSVVLSSVANPVVTGNVVNLTALVASPRAGVVYTDNGSVTFYSGTSAVTAPVALQNGQASAAVVLPQGIHYVVAKYQLNPTDKPVASPPLAVMVTPAACGLTNLASGATVVGSGFRFDRLTNQFVQDVDIKNPTGTPIEGPISLVVAGLSANATLATPYALTTCNSPGTPVVDVGLCPGSQLGSGQTIRVTLRFNNPTRTPITYAASALSGLGRR